MENRIRELRTEAGLTCTELAKRAGISRATLWSLETGRAANVFSRTLIRIADALDRTVDEVFFDKND